MPIRHISATHLLLFVGSFIALLWPEAPALAAEPGAHEGEGHEGGHHDVFATILLELVILIAVAMLGRWAAKQTNQPSVLGELLAGLALGNIGYWLGLPLCTLVMHFSEAGAIFRRILTSDVSVSQAATQLEGLGEAGPDLVALMSGPQAPELVLMAITLWLFSNLGVILLLFMVGLESSVSEMKKVGLPATLVAVVGVVLPLVLGYASGMLLAPEETPAHHLFVAATLCATSVGITAAVLKDMGKLQTPEGKVILGAAVIDDVLGLILLAVVIGIIVSGGIDPIGILRISALALGFLGVLIIFGEHIVRATSSLYKLFDRANLKLFYPLIMAFALAWLASLVGLATIVGAFAAGLIVSERYLAEGEGESAAEVLAPLGAAFAPIFFLLMGMQVNLAVLVEPSTLLAGLTLSVVAVIGKVLAGWAAGKGVHHLSIGIGMIPRGEVGLIFASIGKSLGVVDDAVFSAIVIMVVVTTLIAPIGLKWTMGDRVVTNPA